MNQCDETEEGVHPSETPLCGQHDNQTKAQSRPDFSESLFLDSEEDVATADRYSDLSSDSGPLYKSSFRSASLSDPLYKSSFRSASLSDRPDFSESPFSNSEEDVATADRYSDLSSDSWLDPGESLSSYLKKDSFQSSDSGCVSKKKKALSYHHDIDFKKKRLDSSESPSSHPLKDVATADRYSVLSSDSWEKEKTAPPTTQELVVGSSSEIETKSTHLPEAV